MKKDRQSRLVAILALCVSVVGLTLGFAAFSNTLTISSSATVSPNELDFDINVYGIKDSQGLGGYPSLELYQSADVSDPIRGLNNSPAAISATTAKITDNGKSITISDINVELSEPGQSADYFFLIKNEGEYDAYLDLTNVEGNTFDVPQEGTCTPGKDATPALVENACHNIWLSRMLEDSSGYGHIGGEYTKIPKGDYLILDMGVEYHSGTDDRADGDFSVAFEELTLKFTTIPPTE